MTSRAIPPRKLGLEGKSLARVLRVCIFSLLRKHGRLPGVRTMMTCSIGIQSVAGEGQAHSPDDGRLKH